MHRHRVVSTRCAAPGLRPAGLCPGSYLAAAWLRPPGGHPAAGFPRSSLSRLAPSLFVVAGASMRKVARHPWRAGFPNLVSFIAGGAAAARFACLAGGHPWPLLCGSYLALLSYYRPPAPGPCRRLAPSGRWRTHSVMAPSSPLLSPPARALNSSTTATTTRAPSLYARRRLSRPGGRPWPLNRPLAPPPFVLYLCCSLKPGTSSSDPAPSL